MNQLTDLLGLALPFLLLALLVWFLIWAAFKISSNSQLISARLRRVGPADALYAGVTVILFHLAWINTNAESFFPPLISLYLKGEAAQTPVLKQREAIDTAFFAFAQNGNVFLRFVGFDPEKKTDHDFMELYYFRAAYAAYPRRVYCADPHAAITRAADIGKLAFAPDEHWLDAHQVATVSTFTMGDNGHVVQEAVARASY
jgi:hypothetical protein